MERRLNRLATVWSRGGTRVVSRQERELTGQFGFALDVPCAVAAADADDQLAYWRRIIAYHRAPPALVERCLVTALVARGCRDDEVIEAIRVDGLDGMLGALARQGAEVAAWQRAERERDTAEREATEVVKKAKAKAAYFATHPFATDRDFEVNVWPRVHWKTDDADELAAMLAAAEERERRANDEHDRPNDAALRDGV